MDDNRKFPDYFPEGCPPDDAKEMETHAYRFCENPIYEHDENWKTFYDRNPEKYKNMIQAYGLSFFLDKRNTEKFMKTKSFKNITIVEGLITSDTGVVKDTSKNNNAHHTWWLYENVKPHLYFKICKG